MARVGRTDQEEAELKQQISPAVAGIIVVVILVVVGLLVFKGTSGGSSVAPGGQGNGSPFAPGGAGNAAMGSQQPKR